MDWVILFYGENKLLQKNLAREMVAQAAQVLQYESTDETGIIRPTSVILTGNAESKFGKGCGAFSEKRSFSSTSIRGANVNPALYQPYQADEPKQRGQSKREKLTDLLSLTGTSRWFSKPICR